MGSLQQQSVLKGLLTEKGNEKDSIHKLFCRAATEYSNQLAVHYEDDDGQQRTISYKNLDETSNRLAKALLRYEKYENARQPIVAVCMNPSDRLPTILISILKAGMAYLPLDVEFPASKVKHILQDAEPIMVIVENGVDTSVYGETLTVTYEELSKKACEETKDALNIEKTSKPLAIVLYTSGSTGIPKGVLLPHTAVLNRLQWQWRELPYASNEERCVFKTSLTFVDSVSEIWGPLLQGRTLVVIPKHITKDPERFVPLLEKHRIQRLVLVPSLLHSLLMYFGLHEKNSILSSLKLWVCSGETLPLSLAEQFFATFNDSNRVLANFYGSTEIMGDVTYHLMSKRSELQGIEKVPIGKPIDNCVVYIVNKDMRLVPQGEVGELIVAGRNLASGYIRDRDSHKFLDNPHAIDPEYSRVYRTGDYARIVKGTIIYEGRVDSQIKIRGHRVDLVEVEKAVSRVPGVEKAVVLCYKPGELSQSLVAFVTTKDNLSVSNSQIEDYLQAALAPYMQPQVVIVDQIPLLTNGKTDRQALLKHYESFNRNTEEDMLMTCDYTGVPEKDLAKAKVLFPTISCVIGRSGRATVTLNSNFYELGGNSLNSIYTVTKLRDQGYHIGITEFLTAKNLKEVLTRMKLSNDEEMKETFDEEPYTFEMLNHSHKPDAVHIVTESFYANADLERWLVPPIARQDYVEMMNVLWDPLIEKNLSFVAKSRDGKVIGVTLNFDLWDEPELILTSRLTIIFEFLEHLEGPIREHKLPRGKGKLIHNFMMTTDTEMNPAEKVIAMKEMEMQCLKLAKRKGYSGIFTTNTSPLTQQLGSDVYYYETMLNYQVNKYVAPDGSKPFGKAPDSQVAICSLKMVE